MRQRPTSRWFKVIDKAIIVLCIVLALVSLASPDEGFIRLSGTVMVSIMYAWTRRYPFGHTQKTFLSGMFAVAALCMGVLAIISEVF